MRKSTNIVTNFQEQSTLQLGRAKIAPLRPLAPGTAEPKKAVRYEQFGGQPWRETRRRRTFPPKLLAKLLLAVIDLRGWT